MKGDFVIKFLESLRDNVLDLGHSLGKVSYKGFRYSDFNFGDCEENKKYSGFKNLERRGIIKDINSGNFVFTKNGQKWFRESADRYFKNKNKGKWDKKWRVIIFDIPQELHKERIRFRRKLKLLGCIMLQKSVFVFPYPCDEEVGDICEKLRITDFVDLLMAESVGFRESELRKIFKL